MQSVLQMFVARTASEGPRGILFADTVGAVSANSIVPLLHHGKHWSKRCNPLSSRKALRGPSTA